MGVRRVKGAHRELELAEVERIVAVGIENGPKSWDKVFNCPFRKTSVHEKADLRKTVGEILLRDLVRFKVRNLRLVFPSAELEGWSVEIITEVDCSTEVVSVIGDVLVGSSGLF